MTPSGYSKFGSVRLYIDKESARHFLGTKIKYNN